MNSARIKRGLMDREAADKLSHYSAEEILDLLEERQAWREQVAAKPVTYSANVFIPVTNVCRNRCGYCGFVARRECEHSLLSPGEVDDILGRAAFCGCKEALFTLGEGADLYSSAIAAQLVKWGYRNMTAYLYALGERALAKGLFPHTNAGILNLTDIARLREVNASMGLMLESSSLRLCREGGPHFGCPGKIPTARLRTISDAGALKVPFTTGILVGIGEDWSERVESLWNIRALMAKYGHIQEVIIQNFCAHPDTPLASAPEPAPEEFVRCVALARLMLGPEVNIQVAPNLAHAELASLLLAGANDFGGISPVTRDLVNPEYPWPAIEALELAARETGSRLRERLPIYPEFINRPDFVSDRLLKLIRESAGDDGYVWG